MARSSYPVYVTTAPVASDRHRDREENRGRQSTSGRERGDLVGHMDVRDRDRPSRPILNKHRETSRQGRRRHEYRCYSPHRSSEFYYSGSRNDEERASPHVVKEIAHTSTRCREGRRRRQQQQRHDYEAKNVQSEQGPAHRGDEDGRRGHDRRHSGRGDDDDKGDEGHGRRKTAAQHAGKSAMTPGTLEAVRSRRHGGTGETLKRVATVELSTAAIEAAASKVRHKDPRDRGKGSMLGASIGGLVVDSIVHKLR